MTEHIMVVLELQRHIRIYKGRLINKNKTCHLERTCAGALYLYVKDTC
jgi:hypothetical protein